MQIKTYVVNEMFWSPQGEGMRAGQMSVFIRFTGCNMRCRMDPGDDSPGGFDCDTEFSSGRKLTLDQIVSEALVLVGKPKEWFETKRAWVVFTGGEPTLQVDRELVDALHRAGFLCAIETNGSRPVGDICIDWITVSPKVAEHCVRQLVADEVKYVRGYGQAIPKPTCNATHQLISPVFNGLEIDKQSLAWCLELIRDNPDWRLSVQQHKEWKTR